MVFGRLKIDRYLIVVLLLGIWSCKTSKPLDESVTDAYGVQKKMDESHKELKYGSQYLGKRQDAEMKRFRANRFGQFIHWGLFSIPGGEWNGKIYSGASEWLPNFAKIPGASWDSLQYQFNPVNFAPEKWATMAKEVGMKYVTITTKHHDGFCLWKSDYTDFDIDATPYNGDLIEELVEAYTAEGIDVYLYYSILDWHHLDWRYDIKSEEDSVAFDRFFHFAKNQLLELQSKFPQVKGFWFDGTWDSSWKNNGYYSYDIEMSLKKVNPNIIVNSRLRADELGSRHFDSNGDLMGDYQSGYERYLPEKTDTNITKMDWEACMTLPHNQWGYHKDWTLSHVKSANEVIEMLVQAVSLGGNFLLNYGPKKDGSFRMEEIDVSNEISKWMANNGHVIYNGDYANLKNQDWGYFIQNSQTEKYYGVIFNIPISNQLRIEVPKGRKLKEVILEGESLSIHYQDRMGYYATLPDKDVSSALVIEVIME